jgi:hypothetical protein
MVFGSRSGLSVAAAVLAPEEEAALSFIREHKRANRTTPGAKRNDRPSSRRPVRWASRTFDNPNPLLIYLSLFFPIYHVGMSFYLNFRPRFRLRR